MRAALADATAALFADPTLARDVTITPGGGTARVVRGILTETEEPLTELLSLAVQTPALRCLLDRAAVPTEPTGAMTVAFDARMCRVRTVQTDRDETLWSLTLDEVVTELPLSSSNPAQLPLLVGLY